MKNRNEYKLSDFTVADLRDPEQSELIGKEKSEKYLAEGRTHIFFDGFEGSIYMAVDNGDLVFLDPIKNVLDPESTYQKYLSTKTEEEILDIIQEKKTELNRIENSGSHETILKTED